jgi:hypothetical protein
VWELAQLYYFDYNNQEKIRRLLRTPALPPDWSRAFEEILASAGERGKKRKTPERAWKGFRNLIVDKKVPERRIRFELFGPAALLQEGTRARRRKKKMVALSANFYHCWSVSAGFHNRANPADLFCWRLICAVRLRLKTVLIDYKGGTKDELFE